MCQFEQSLRPLVQGAVQLEHSPPGALARMEETGTVFSRAAGSLINSMVGCGWIGLNTVPNDTSI